MTNSAAGPDPRLTAIAAALPDVLVAVDFDGTLAPIVRDPGSSRPAPGAVEVLVRLAGAGATVAVVTGREAAVVNRLGGLDRIPGVLIEGVYGAQQLRHGTLSALETPPAMRAARAEVDAVLEGASTDPDLWVEDKDVSFVVHARQSADPERAMVDITDAVVQLAARHALELHPGKQVLELRVPGIDKGRALTALLADLDPAALLWAGDDLGDVPAFVALADWRARTGRPALGVAVAPAPSADPLAGRADDPLAPELVEVADLTVGGPVELVELLTRLLQPRTAAS